MKKNVPHKQVMAKVNAPVDEGIIELIEVLGQFPGLQTIESCQGDVNDPQGDTGAWVCFYFGRYWHDSWQDLAEFVLGFMGPKLVGSLNDLAHVSIHVSTFGKIRGELTVRPGAMIRTLRVLKRLVREYSR